MIIHAGDVLTQSVPESLRKFSKVHAVPGNNDSTLVLPEQLDLCFGGVNIGVIHDSGPVAGRSVRMRRKFPEAL